MSKIVFDDHTNLLRENYYEYDVQDVQEANLFPEIFNFDEVPKVAFNQRLVPMRMPKDVWITDTTRHSVTGSSPARRLRRSRLCACLTCCMSSAARTA